MIGPMGGAERDQLYLLQPFFADPGSGGGLFHCPGSARVEGLLSFYPFLRTRLDVRYVDFPKPRHPLIELLGPDHQGCPVLVVAPGREAVEGATRSPTGRLFVADSLAIAAYLAREHGIPAPHP
jgi:hypothetical protein